MWAKLIAALGALFRLILRIFQRWGSTDAKRKTILKKMRENRRQIKAAINASDVARLADLVAIRKLLSEELAALSAK